MFTPNRWIKIVALLALFVLPAACIGPQPSREATPAATGEETAPTVTASTAADTELTSSLWELAQIATRDGAVLKPNNSAEYSLAFGEDGLVTAQIGACNLNTGSYVIDGDQLTFGMMDGSIVACPPDSLVDDFAAGLTDARSYSIEGDTLRISTRTGVMRFTAAASEGESAMGQTTPDATPDVTTEPSAQAAVTGTVAYVERIALPTGATITVRLVDVSRADAAAELIAEQVSTTEGQQVPIPFELTYDPAQIVDSHRYAVQAFIELDGQLLFISDTIIPVLTMDAPSSDVEVMVVPVPSSTDDDSSEAPAEGEAGAEEGSSEDAANELTGVVWQWQRTQMNGDSTTVPATPANYTLEFAADGSVAIQADCNSGSGPYTQEANLLSFGAIATTLMACPGESQADAYLQQLSQVGSYFITAEGNLILEIQFDSGSMIFAAAQ